MNLGPAPVLALLVGIFHVSLYVLIRGRAGQRLPILIVAAFLGAWAGDAVADRLDVDPLRIGDFHLIASSLLAWVGIVVVALLAVLGDREPRPLTGRAPGPPTDRESRPVTGRAPGPPTDGEPRPPREVRP